MNEDRADELDARGDRQMTTVPVTEEVFAQVYDSPAALPGRYRWVTPDEDVRRLEDLLGMSPGTIGAPLWVSADEEACTECGRRPTWLDIVDSSLQGVHPPEMVARVILGEQKYVNIEAPRAIEGVRCIDCEAPFTSMRSFKCHNWAYAKPALLEVIERMEQSRRSG